MTKGRARRLVNCRGRDSLLLILQMRAVSPLDSVLGRTNADASVKIQQRLYHA